jgi:hypothetical protein
MALALLMTMALAMAMAKAKKTIVMRRQGQTLISLNFSEAEALEQFPQNCDLNVVIRKARSLRQNNTYWGWLGWLISDGPEFFGKNWKTAEALSDSLQLDLGYVRKIKRFNGDVDEVPESKNFEEMSQERFNEYFNFCRDYIEASAGYDTVKAYLERGKHETQ